MKERVKIRRQTEQTNKIAKDGKVLLRQCQRKLQPLSISVKRKKHKCQTRDAYIGTEGMQTNKEYKYRGKERGKMATKIPLENMYKLLEVNARSTVGMNKNQSKSKR